MIFIFGNIKVVSHIIFNHIVLKLKVPSENASEKFQFITCHVSQGSAMEPALYHRLNRKIG